LDSNTTGALSSGRSRRLADAWLPADIAPRRLDNSPSVVHSGLTDAAKVTFLLPIGVLLLGILAAAAMKPTAPRRRAAAPSTQPEAATA
jgi:hypothetical protein